MQHQLGTGLKRLTDCYKKEKNQASGLMKLPVFIGNEFGKFQELIREQNIWFSYRRSTIFSRV